MKKILVVILTLLITSTASAGLVRTTYVKYDRFRVSNYFDNDSLLRDLVGNYDVVIVNYLAVGIALELPAGSPVDDNDDIDGLVTKSVNFDIEPMETLKTLRLIMTL